MSETIQTGPQFEEGTAELARIVADIMDGKTDLAVAAGLTDDDLEAVYAAGHGLYTAGKYDEALSFFQLLCTCRQSDSRFWFGLGACSQMLGETSNALRAYGMAALFDTENPQISLRAAECLVKLGDTKTGRIALEAVIELAAGKPDQSVYAERARLTLNMLDREESGA
jgi:type III secretion system low calcium response chaperone LcrH/SycD